MNIKLEKFTKHIYLDIHRMLYRSIIWFWRIYCKLEEKKLKCRRCSAQHTLHQYCSWLSLLSSSARNLSGTGEKWLKTFANPGNGSNGRIQWSGLVASRAKLRFSNDKRAPTIQVCFQRWAGGMDGWMDGWMDGRMDGWKTSTIFDITTYSAILPRRR